MRVPLSLHTNDILGADTRDQELKMRPSTPFYHIAFSVIRRQKLKNVVYETCNILQPVMSLQQAKHRHDILEAHKRDPQL